MRQLMLDLIEVILKDWQARHFSLYCLKFTQLKTVHNPAHDFWEGVTSYVFDAIVLATGCVIAF